MQRFSKDDTNRKLILRQRKKNGTYPKRGKEVPRTFESYFVYVPLTCLMQKFMGNQVMEKGKLEDAIYFDCQRAFGESLHKRLARNLPTTGQEVKGCQSWVKSELRD